MYTISRSVKVDMFAPIKYLLVDSAALLLINLAAAPLPPAPASGGAGGLTDTGDGAQYYLLSPVKREEFSCFYVLALMAASL